VSKSAVLCGGCGFIGANLQRAKRLFQKEPWSVRVIDNLATSHRRNMFPGCALIEDDIVEPRKRTLEVIGEADLVYFLPALPAYDDIIKDPQANLWIHSVGLLNTLRSMKDGTTIIFASSSHAYGEAKWGYVWREGDTGNVSTLAPLAVYQEAKRFGEALVWTERKRLKVGIARIFNVFGPWASNDGRVMERFINAALDNKPIEVYGEHDARSYLYVKDLDEGLKKLEDYVGDEGPLCVNLGADEAIENIDLAVKIKELTESQSDINLHPRRRGDLSWRCPDITLAREKLGWKPRHTLTEGLEKTIEWWREIRQG